MSAPVTRPRRPTTRRAVAAEAGRAAAPVAALAGDIDAFLDELSHGRRLSDNTVDAYARDLADYRSFAERHGLRSWQEATRVFVDAYFAHIHAERGLARATTARRRSALRGFHAYLARRAGEAADPLADLPAPRQERRLPRALSHEDVERLLAQPREDSLLGLRDRAMLELAYASGLRVSELCGLERRNLDLEERTLTVLGKRSKERTVPFGRPAEHALRAWLDRGRDLVVRHERHDFVFANARGRKLSRMGFWKILRGHARAAGLAGGVHPHVLRHSFATELLLRGADLRVVQELLGHASVVTTAIYTHLDRAYLREVHRTCHPRA